MSHTNKQIRCNNIHSFVCFFFKKKKNILNFVKHTINQLFNRFFFFLKKKNKLPIFLGSVLSPEFLANEEFEKKSTKKEQTCKTKSDTFL
jgi:hypothetical protein